jgi:hypothetical protein
MSRAASTAPTGAGTAPTWTWTGGTPAVPHHDVSFEGARP